MLRLIYYPTAIILAVIVLTSSLDELRLIRIASAQQNFEHVTEIAWKSIWEKLSFSLYSGASKAKSDIEDLYVEASKHARVADRCALAFFILSISFLALRSWLARGRGGHLNLSVTADLLGVSMICLAVGLSAPIFSLKAYTALPMLGEVVLKFEAKSVLTTVLSLLRSGSLFIAILVATFSIITPMIKILVAIIVVQHRWPVLHRSAVEFIKAIGKWSMADVFVVAIFVAYFAASGDEFSDANLGIGLYFFTTYCLLSLIATQNLASSLYAQNGLNQ